MKNVISMTFIVMLVTFFCCACGLSADPAPAAEPTAPAVTTETEVLFFDGFVGLPQELVSTYDESGTLTKTEKTEFHENGNISALITAEYDADGNVLYYQEKNYRPNGNPAETLIKHYDADGTLTKQVDISYWSNEVLKRYEVRHFSPTGALLELTANGYHDNGAPAEVLHEQLDETAGQRLIRQEIRHVSGQLTYFRDGAFHPETYELLDGTIEEYSIDGPLIWTETIRWDEKNRTRYHRYYSYVDESSGEIKECFDISGHLIAGEYHVFEPSHVLFQHYMDLRDYDEQGNLLRQDIQHYLDSGEPGDRFETVCTYDSANQLLSEETAHYLAGGKRQNLAVTEYAYDEGRLVKKSQSAFDHNDVCKSAVTAQYDADGMVTTFTTMSSSGNTYSYDYSYDEFDRIVTELMTTRYKSAPRVDYQETTYEFHENGQRSRVSVHTWTSYDEAKYPDKPRSDLGKTTVTEYDKHGNKIKK